MQKFDNFIVHFFTVAIFALVVLAVVAAWTEPPQVVAGDRRGNRCYDGTRWIDCPLAEKPLIQTKTEMLTEVRYRDDTYARVDVIETAANCLYVAIHSEYPKVISITSQPKTAAGCK